MKIQKIKPELPFIFITMLCILVLMSCNGCRSAKVSCKQNAAISTPPRIHQEVNSIPDTNKYLYQDDSVLSRLKLTRVPKAEVVGEIDENGNWGYAHMFDKNGKYLGVFDPAPWENGKSLDNFMLKYQNELKEPLEINEKTRELYWNELKTLGYNIPKNKFNEMRYLGGQGLKIGPAKQWYATENSEKAYGLRGTRRLCLSKDIYSGDCDIFFHETYLFDYTGKLIKIFNYDEMGQDLMLFEGGKKGISQYLNSDWDEIPIKFFRFHDFENSSFLDFDAYTICKDYFYRYPVFLRSLYYIDMHNDKVDMVFEGGEKHEIYINIIVDTKVRTAYCKLYEIPYVKGHSEWKLFTKPDGSKINLSEYEAIKF